MRNIRKRAVPLGFIGSVSKYLFGILSEEDGERYNAQIKKLTRKQLDLAKIAKDDAHLVHNQLNNLEHRINGGKMDIQRALIKLNKTAKDLYSLTSDWYRWSNTADVNMVLNEVESMINLFDDTLNNIFAIISYAKVNSLHPELVNPTHLHKVIRQIEDHNGEIEFPLPIDKARIEKLTNIADINLGYKDRKIVVKARIPLLEKNPTYLYQMHSVPIAQRLNDAKISASVKPRSKYIAVNEHAQYYSFLNVDDLQDCKQDHHRKTCRRKHFMIEASTMADCEYMLLHKPSLANLSECNLLITSESRDTWIHLDTINGWLYSLKDEHSLLISCEDQKGYVTLQGVGILQLKPKCHAKYKHTTITSQGIGESIQFFYLPNLRLNMEPQEWVYLLSAVRALLHHDDVLPTLYEIVWRSLHRILYPHDVPHAGPRCHEETWEPKEEGVCSICGRLYSEPHPPVNQWIPLHRRRRRRRVLKI
uniref:Uncharacterized protein n=1 Tax=Trichogramma kaykai TaxID=54128 RepID=A0ABD2WAQ8_9HYME